MKYNIDDVKNISSSELIKRIQKNPETYFQSGKPNAAEITAGITEEALDAGCKDIRIQSIQGWWQIRFDFDWIGSLGSKKYFTFR